MKRLLFLTIFAFSLAMSESADLQIIHNSPYHSIDVYVNNIGYVRDFSFRTATERVDVPATSLIGVALANEEIFADFPFPLDINRSYVLAATGIVGDQNKPFDLVLSSLDTVASNRNYFALKLFHGVTDAPALDIYVNGSMIAERLEFGRFNDYIQLPASDCILEVIETGSEIHFGSFNLALSQMQGKAGIVYGSGFMSPTDTDSVFAMHLVTPDGQSTKLPVVENVLDETARVQIIHNSPYPIVDVYVDGVEALGDVEYRNTTALIDLPIATTVGIAPANGDIIANFPFSLESGENYVVTASGILNDANRPFDLIASTLDTAAVDENHFALKVFHGVTDAPAVDIYANGNLLVDSLDYGDYAGYVQVPVGDYTIDVAAHGSTTPVASFAAPLTGLGGGTGIVFATGFLTPTLTDSAFTLILTTPSGYDVELPATSTALDIDYENSMNPNTFSLNQNYPNPFNPSTNIGFEIFQAVDVEITVYDVNGRFINTLIKGYMNAGNHSITWDGVSSSGKPVSAGIYLYSITAGKNTAIKKMSFIK